MMKFHKLPTLIGGVACLLWLAFVLVVAPAPAKAQGPLPAGLGDAFGAETLAPGAVTAIGFTAATAANARTAFCTVETVSIRFRVDGTNPTAAVGHLQLSSATSNVEYAFFVTNRTNITRFRMIATSGTSSVFCTYFR